MLVPRRTLLAAWLLSATLLPTLGQADEPLITNGSFTAGMTGWRVNLLEGARATGYVETTDEGKSAVHINVPQAEAKRWFVQLVHTGVKLQADKTYHLRFRARAIPAGAIGVMTGALHNGKFEESSRQDGIALTEKWAEYTCDIKPKSSDDDGHLIFTGLAAQAGDYRFTDVSLTAGE